MKKYSKSYQKLFKATLAATMATGAFVTVAPTFTEAATPSLKDLDKGQDYYLDVIELVERGIVKGFPDGTYKPFQTVTRGQAAKILANILELDTVNVVNPGFSDVKVTDEYYGAIAALAQKGIISGYPDKTYGQADTLTRSQMAKIISIGFDFEVEPLTDNRFNDVKASDPFAGYVQTLITNDITKGTTPTTYSPAAPVVRGQMASFVVRGEKAANKVAPGGGGGGGGGTPGPDYTAGNADLNAKIDTALGGLLGTGKVEIDLESNNKVAVKINDSDSKLSDFRLAAKPFFEAFQLDTTVTSVILKIDSRTFTDSSINSGHDMEAAISAALAVLGEDDSFKLTRLTNNTISITVTGVTGVAPGKAYSDTYSFVFTE
ncbi:S-layer homology domain-containing protein [Sporosarcina sp. CAU 1771]